MFRSKLTKVLALKKHLQAGSAQTLAQVQRELQEAQQVLDEVASVRQEYRVMQPPDSARLLKLFDIVICESDALEVVNQC